MIQELEESYQRSKEVPSVPESMKRELSNLSSQSEDDEDDALSYFQKLAES